MARFNCPENHAQQCVIVAAGNNNIECLHQPSRHYSSDHSLQQSRQEAGMVCDGQSRTAGLGVSDTCPVQELAELLINCMDVCLCQLRAAVQVQGRHVCI